MLIDETARAVAALVEKVDGVLKSALGDGEQASGLTLRFAAQLAEVSAGSCPVWRCFGKRSS